MLMFFCWFEKGFGGRCLFGGCSLRVEKRLNPQGFEPFGNKHCKLRQNSPFFQKMKGAKMLNVDKFSICKCKSTDYQ